MTNSDKVQRDMIRVAIKIIEPVLLNGVQINLVNRKPRWLIENLKARYQMKSGGSGLLLCTITVKDSDLDSLWSDQAQFLILTSLKKRHFKVLKRKFCSSIQDSHNWVYHTEEKKKIRLLHLGLYLLLEFSTNKIKFYMYH